MLHCSIKFQHKLGYCKDLNAHFYLNPFIFIASSFRLVKSVTQFGVPALLRESNGF